MGELLNVNIESINAKKTYIDTKNGELSTKLQAINSKFEGIQGMSSRDVIKIREKYADAKQSQKELTEAVTAISAYLSSVARNYEEAQTQVN